MKRFLAIITAVALAAALLPASALALQPGSADFGSASAAKAGTVSVQASKAAKNKAAHKAYKKKMRSLKKQAWFTGSYRFIDLTHDGVDELVTLWWPAVYTYKGGKVKRVYSASYGSESVVKAYKAKKVFVVCSPDHVGSASYSYWWWNSYTGSFTWMATKYTPSKYGKKAGYRASYRLRGVGDVSKKQANASIKRFIGKSKATKITYKKAF